MKRTVIALLLLIFFADNATSQALAAYHNNANFFMVFEGGIENKIEFLPVKKFKIGADKIAYLDNVNNFKVYHRGEKYHLEDTPVDSFNLRGGLLTYITAGVLKVLEDEGPEIIGMRVKDFSAGDSIVAFYDLNTYMFAVYYNGQRKNLENILSSGSFTNFKTGRNIMAYFSPVGDLRVFYEGEVRNLLYNVMSTSYKVGKNTVAFTDPNAQEFKAFYKGEIYTLEYTLPKSFEVGDDRIAYMDNLGNFKCFENGEVTTILSYEPDFYHLNEGILLYNNQQRLNVYHNGSNELLEYYFPPIIQIRNKRLAYIDQMGGIKLYDNGKPMQVTTTKVLGFQLNPQTVSYRVWNNSHKVFYNGETF